MPKEKAEKSLCMSGLRHAEYYGIQEVFDDLYAKSSKNETFTNLMNIILKRENILLAYRNIKSNDGSKTPGTDGVTFDDIGKLMPDEVIIQSVSLQSAVHMGIVRNLSEEKKYQNLTTQQKPGRWESPVSGTGWYNNVSSRS